MAGVFRSLLLALAALLAVAEDTSRPCTFDAEGFPRLKYLRPKCDLNLEEVSKGIQFVGMYNSGTTWLLKTFNWNFRNPTSIVHLPIFKHAHLNYIDEEFFTTKEREKYLYVVLVKDPAHWVKSLERRPYGRTTGPYYEHKVGETHTTVKDPREASFLGEFKMSPANLPIDLRIDQGRMAVFASAVEAWTSWHSAWLDSRANFVFLRYEDLLAEPGKVLEEFEALLEETAIQQNKVQRCDIGRTKEEQHLEKWEGENLQKWDCVDGAWVLATSVKTNGDKERKNLRETDLSFARNSTSAEWILDGFSYNDICWISRTSQPLLNRLAGRFTSPGYPRGTFEPERCPRTYLDCSDASVWDNAFRETLCTSFLECGGCFDACTAGQCLLPGEEPPPPTLERTAASFFGVHPEDFRHLVVWWVLVSFGLALMLWIRHTTPNVKLKSLVPN